eukprot:Platyproteum_vivax@DN16222_c0_g1_i1.p1
MWGVFRVLRNKRSFLGQQGALGALRSFCSAQIKAHVSPEFKRRTKEHTKKGPTFVSERPVVKIHNKKRPNTMGFLCKEFREATDKNEVEELVQPAINLMLSKTMATPRNLSGIMASLARHEVYNDRLINIISDRCQPLLSEFNEQDFTQLTTSIGLLSRGHPDILTMMQMVIGYLKDVGFGFFSPYGFCVTLKAISLRVSHVDEAFIDQIDKGIKNLAPGLEDPRVVMMLLRGLEVLRITQLVTKNQELLCSLIKRHLPVLNLKQLIQIFKLYRDNNFVDPDLFGPLQRSLMEWDKQHLDSRPVWEYKYTEIVPSMRLWPEGFWVVFLELFATSRIRHPEMLQIFMRQSMRQFLKPMYSALI